MKCHTTIPEGRNLPSPTSITSQFKLPTAITVECIACMLNNVLGMRLFMLLVTADHTMIMGYRIHGKLATILLAY